MNVLVYSGPGASVEAVRQCTDTLQRLLTPHYAVVPISAEALIREPWAPTCALLCLPGGADLGYCKALNGIGTRVLKQYVRRGGKFLGFCAGAYFASADIEFEKGDLSLEVTGTRELGFFPGLCRGAAFKGFKYNSEAGARFCGLAVTGKLLDMGAPDSFRSYYNGGGVFINAERLMGQGIDVLARYREELDVDAEGGNAAAVGCQVGAGYALLVGAHPEFTTGKSGESSCGRQGNNQFQREWESNEARRLMFMSALFKLLGLKSNNNTELALPSPSTLHLSGLNPEEVTSLWGGLKNVRSSGADGAASVVIEAEATTFLLESHDIAPSTSIPDNRTNEDSIVRVKIYENSLPTDEETPSFSILTYFQRLRSYHNQLSNKFNFGSPLLYGELMTSTNSILDRNFKLLQKLPSGFTVVATRQTAARGRGSNPWISPIGGLVFSMVLRHGAKHTTKSPAVFIQYLIALSIVKSIKSYDIGYDKMPVYIKWPNDIYVKDKGDMSEKSSLQGGFAKIGGILVNANFADEEFFLVIGCGINVTNAVPTTSLKILAESMDPPLPAYEHEKLLGKILATFELHYARFLKEGFQVFEQEYYQHWLHNNQIVNLDDGCNSKACIQGISMDDGMLVVSELNEDNLNTGKEFKLQADGNSFDFFNGLLKKKN